MSTKILVVDNEQRMCNIIKQSLEIDQYVVQAAYSGKEAIEQIDQSDFDVIKTLIKNNQKHAKSLEICKTKKTCYRGYLNNSICHSGNCPECNESRSLRLSDQTLQNG